jgi:hypothetical protein
MLTVMLCGAADTSEVALAFKEEIKAFGGEPWHYQDGHISYFNSIHSNWVTNSQATIKEADLCVFVIIRQVGELTWNVELKLALAEGKPFLLFCHTETLNRYYDIKRAVNDLSALTPDMRTLFELLRDLESKNLTVVRFETTHFRDDLKRELSHLFAGTLKLLETKNQRTSILFSVKPDTQLTSFETNVLIDISTDESEDKTFRKQAIYMLRSVGINDSEKIRELLSSYEQGVRRLTVQYLGELYKYRPFPEDLLDFCVETANEADDVGIARRLISSILDIDLTAGLKTLQRLDLTEIGARRRLAGALEDHEAEILASHSVSVAIELANRCLLKTNEAGWLNRCKELASRLSAVKS